ncbi:MAG: hypothetical protein KGZ88_15200 [Methylomicrobium sp.]|nr:hypothetical protein [Methylomicrobium sp.]
MLDFLKPKNVKVAVAVAQLFRPALHAIESSHGGILPASALQDDYLIGYLAGAIAVAANFAGIVNPKLNGLTNLHFFDRLFPRHGLTICRAHPEKLENSDEYLKAYQDGITDFNKIIGDLGALDLKSISGDLADMTHLRAHIEQTYPLE